MLRCKHNWVTIHGGKELIEWCETCGTLRFRVWNERRQKYRYKYRRPRGSGQTYGEMVLSVIDEARRDIHGLGDAKMYDSGL